jgi:hypothetical protein
VRAWVAGMGGVLREERQSVSVRGKRIKKRRGKRDVR